ncbi:hypothetical protein [Endozoicomonas sp. SCSIO W0465]|uniref:hypothetical protein n=1 Tax=Endozoicomonas sp. SCSIO W0465 TaxID=2918516 RepID=UPI0020757600|nr:hypothetical protein [Endozoicomonas sp. SCSIO W0465]USE39345.1 hypothetical protein MJO57_14975 [Endozoicomonas sp. SCSIO W0465]
MTTTTNGGVKLHFNGGDIADDKNEPFELRNSNDGRISYTITVESKLGQRPPKTFDKDHHHRALGFWSANDKAENCENIPNMSFTIQADKDDINAASAGVYRDTMTVTVEAK